MLLCLKKETGNENMQLMFLCLKILTIPTEVTKERPLGGFSPFDFMLYDGLAELGVAVGGVVAELLLDA